MKDNSFVFPFLNVIVEFALVSSKRCYRVVLLVLVHCFMLCRFELLKLMHLGGSI